MRASLVSVCLAVTCLTAFAAPGAGAALPDRASDPVVLKGSAVPGVVGTSPGAVVAFRWDEGWQQVPVQVDERKTVNLRDLYPISSHTYLTAAAVNLEVYADPGTRVGADNVATVDTNDEIVFMAADSGGVVPDSAYDPPGTITDSGNEVKIDDPLTGQTAYVYLYRSAASPNDSDPAFSCAAISTRPIGRPRATPAR